MVNLCPSTFYIGHTIVTQPNVLFEHRKSYSFVLVYRVRPVMFGTLRQMITRHVLHLAIHTYTAHSFSCAPPHHQIDLQFAEFISETIF